MLGVIYIFHILWILSLVDLSWEATLKKDSYHGSGRNQSRNPTEVKKQHQTVETTTMNVSSSGAPNANKTTVGPAEDDEERQLELYGYSKASYFDTELSCENTRCADLHVMCQYPWDGPSENCEGYLRIPIRKKDVLKIIHLFNYRRNLVAGGQEYRLPPASSMRILEWDRTLASFAQRWADQCIYDPNILRDVTLLSTITDHCRDLPEWEVAQVSARVHSTGNNRVEIDSLVHLLINTISSNFFNVTAHILLSGYVPADDYGAIAFSSSAHSIGCGISSYLLGLKAHNHRVTVIYCNIAPLNGMHLLDQYYQQGAPCTDCPSGTSCDPESYFKFLCQPDSSLDTESEIRHIHYHHSASDNHRNNVLFPITVAVFSYLFCVC